MTIDSRENEAPLRGKYIAVACSPEKSRRILDGLRVRGAKVDLLEVIAILELDDKSTLDEALARIDSYAWVIFTSSYAALFFARRMSELGIACETPRPWNVCAVGPGTADTLREHGISVSLVPDEFVAEGVLRALSNRHGGLEGLAGARVLVPRAKEAREVLSRELSAAGVLVDVVPCYETVPGEVDSAVLTSMREHAPDLLVFTSSSTVRNFLGILGEEDGKLLLRSSIVAALGPITASTLESLGRKPEILPRESTIPSLLEAIVEFYRLR